MSAGIIPPQAQATQVPPPPIGSLPGWLYRTLGPSYRTTLAGFATGVVTLVDGVVVAYPDLLPVRWRGPVILALNMLAGGGIWKLGSAAKDKSATGVE